MKRFLMAALVFISATLWGCNSGGGDPKAILKDFMTALSKKDFATAKKLSTKSSAMIIDELAKRANSTNSPFAGKMDKFSPEKITMGEPVIEGDKATIAVKQTGKDESINFTLRKESGDWKVAFDKGTLMGTFFDKMTEKGLNINSVMDSISEGFKEMKNINADSITDEVRKSLEKAPLSKERMEEIKKKLEQASPKNNQ